MPDLAEHLEGLGVPMEVDMVLEDVSGQGQAPGGQRRARALESVLTTCGDHACIEPQRTDHAPGATRTPCGPAHRLGLAFVTDR